MTSIEEFKAGLQTKETDPDLLSPLFEGTDISLLELVKIQAQVLTPVLRAFRAELGEERANEIALPALRAWSRDVYLKIGEEAQGTPREKWEAISLALSDRVGDAAEFEFTKQEPDALEFHIHRCRYAEFFQQLGEPELGAVLTCEGDQHAEEVGGADVELTRPQTIMKGATFCDFRYRMKGRSGA